LGGLQAGPGLAAGGFQLQVVAFEHGRQDGRGEGLGKVQPGLGYGANLKAGSPEFG
jgi:hypothetical protein